MRSPIRSSPLFACLLFAALAAGTVTAEAGLFSWNPTPPADVPQSGATAAQFADPAQQAVRIENLESSVRQLNGRIDELTHQIQVLQGMLQRAQEDNEFRLNKLEGGKPQKRSDAAPALSPGLAPSIATEAPVDTANADDPSGLTPAADIGLPQNGFSVDVSSATLNDGGENLLGSPPQTLGTLPADAAGPLDLSAIARGDAAAASLPPATVADAGGLPGVGVPAPIGGAGATLSQPVVAGQLPPPPTLVPPGGAAVPAAGTEVASLEPPANDPRTSYEAAYAKVMSGDYAGAEAGFRRFLADYPKDQLAGGATYWLGETYYARGQYRDAATSFLSTYKDYPKNSKAADALFKLGLSLEGLGEKSAACATYGELSKKFPKAQPVLLSRVTVQRTKLGCS